ncbi:hypothetical protein VOLCADRAFT_98769 [Volvox carteri f. nagariensis]|uniref:Uncharacterized protein n=1 Tax=Volvox carteri f. nagariensis TaxID=3068 RepID=D8UG90_VOLCA|nr:uncharacterized protein VOLCADRAFT_98769 [Volvox carteri f. nagariensis]EFJ41247.1 hypothetical protein VOLCADRAFT_98769 [Volvox carteri f. nagariensis]|eukprot:XP_002957698.1 hypothetical protein VOLCADRAFT_98769 [Volvox carteri f. nagariensis]
MADLNGDGHLELVVATPDLKLQVIQPAPHGHRGEGFARAAELNAISLLFKRALVAAGHRPVALAVGYLDPLPAERVRPLRKAVIVIVTASWRVMCFDHNLVLKWEYDAKMHFPHHARIKEVAVYIAPHQVHEADRGIVIVGASVLRGDLASGEGLESVAEGGPAGFFEDDDVLLSEMREDAERKEHAKSAGVTESLTDLDPNDPLAGLPGSRHFSYVALEGGNGTLRWHHGSGDFHKDLSELGGELTPQNNYRLDASKLDGRHFGEASCRDYRESVLHVLPHVWERPADTRLMEAHFIKHRVGRGAAKGDLAAAGTKAAAKGRGLKAPDDGGKHHAKSGLLSSGLLSPSIHKGPGAVRRTKHSAGLAPLQHGRGGVHARDARAHDHAHHGGAAHGGAAVAGGASGGTPDPHMKQHLPHNVTANALVAFLEEGVEVLHLYSGRTVCKLHLPPRTLHADINGDGVLDHVSVYHGHVGGGVDGNEDTSLLPGELPSISGKGHAVFGRCTAVVRSGIPPTETLFKVQVCHTNKFGVSASRNVFQRAAAVAQPTELATPIMLPIPDLKGFSSKRRQHGMLVFLTNKGEMTAVTGTGSHLWQEYLQVSWPPADENPRHVVPTLAAMALYTHAVPTTVLAAGTEHAVVVSEHGHILAELELPSPPTQPLVVADFNGDGLNDIILVTNRGIYGYVQVPHLAGGMSLSALLLTLVVALGLVYFTQHYDPMGSLGTGGVGGAGTGRRAAKLRSTDYVD